MVAAKGGGVRKAVAILVVVLLTIPLVFMLGCGETKTLGEKLFEAIDEGNGVYKVRKLLEEGANVNERNEYGDTPLIWAAGDGNPEIVGLLVEKGADVNACNKFGDTPLFEAVWDGNTETVELLLLEKADVNARDMHDTTPLHAAARMDKTEIAGLLLKRGADVNARDKNGLTPLGEALQYRLYCDTAELLKQHGGIE